MCKNDKRLFFFGGETSRYVAWPICLLLALNGGRVDAQVDFFERLADSALTLTRQRVVYTPAYVALPYPGGDVPAHTGVCSDVVIRAYRKLGIDLQKEVHEDMRLQFGAYPQRWGLRKPDPNIDHRRVPNLMVFFERKGASRPITNNPDDYMPGHLVCWELPGGQTHIGIVSRQRSPTHRHRYQIIHNIGAGQTLEDCLFGYKIIGHYRYR
ncbi:MAG: DUF1287 domain-containing protein [Saprospiraceae bacterium]